MEKRLALEMRGKLASEVSPTFHYPEIKLLDNQGDHRLYDLLTPKESQVRFIKIKLIFVQNRHVASRLCQTRFPHNIGIDIEKHQVVKDSHDCQKPLEPFTREFVGQLRHEWRFFLYIKKWLSRQTLHFTCMKCETQSLPRATT